MFDPIPSVFTFRPDPGDDHVFNLAIHAHAEYLVTWETRILKLHGATTPAAVELRSLAPQLSIVTPAVLAQKIADNML